MKFPWINKALPACRAFVRILRARRRPLAFTGALLGALLLLFLYYPLNRESLLGVHPSGELADRRGRLLYAFMNGRQQWCFERELAEISPRLVQATLAAEDRHFYFHPGVDPLAAARAGVQNLARRRVVSGASTLTMQVIKQTQGPAGSLWGKLRQAAMALRLERHASKAEILKTYLNTAPYGLNLIGCEAAARRYFGKSSAELTLAEAALLAGLPKAPTSLQPLGRPESARRRRDLILGRMRAGGAIDERDYRAALAEPVRAAWHAFPQLAPHLAMRLRGRVAAQGRLATTLDADIQEKVEALVKRHLAPFAGQVDNAAAIVIDVATAGVLADVGSADFTNPEHGQVDVTRAPRSPGSALKPFTYALALERGELLACETLLDDTADYGLYNPENMDRTYHGLVSAGEALRRSLNVPAVTVLDRIGAPALQSFLRSAGLRTLRHPAEFYGLGLTLGSCEVRLEELAGAYCMLANLGTWRPLKFIEGGMQNAEVGRSGSADALASQPANPPAAPPTPGESGRGRPRSQRLNSAISRGTCIQLYSMMEQALPGELQGEDGPAATFSLAPRVCWKTGTSWGQHDAWAFVFNRHYVVGVWAGNNDARPSEFLTGARAALPLAGRIFRALPAGAGPAWPNPQGELHEVRVCALSGLPATLWCRQSRAVWLPRGQFLTRVCDMHYPAEAPLEASPDAAGVLERWPGSAKGWNLARITSVRPYTRDAQTSASRRGDALRILAPANKAEYILTGAPGGDRLRLAATLDDQTPLHWYLDDRFLGTAQPWQPLVIGLTAGVHKLVCMTPRGLTDEVRFEVFEADALPPDP